MIAAAIVEVVVGAAAAAVLPASDRISCQLLAQPLELRITAKHRPRIPPAAKNFDLVIIRGKVGLATEGGFWHPRRRRGVVRGGWWRVAQLKMTEPHRVERVLVPRRPIAVFQIHHGSFGHGE